MQDEPRRTRIDMEDDAEYRRQLSLFTNCCTEKPTELVKIGGGAGRPETAAALP